jgi:hypothetical protein
MTVIESRTQNDDVNLLIREYILLIDFVNSVKVSVRFSAGNGGEYYLIDMEVMRRFYCIISNLMCMFAM